MKKQIKTQYYPIVYKLERVSINRYQISKCFKQWTCNPKFKTKHYFNALNVNLLETLSAEISNICTYSSTFNWVLNNNGLIVAWNYKNQYNKSLGYHIFAAYSIKEIHEEDN